MPLSPGLNSPLVFHSSFFWSPVPQALQLGNPESHTMSPPAIQAETVPFGAGEKLQSERKLHNPIEVIPNVWRHSGLKHQMLTPSHNPSLNSALGNLLWEVPLSGHLHLSLLSGLPRYALSEKLL